MWEQAAEADVGTSVWTHALAEKSEADPAHFRTGDDLRVALEGALLYCTVRFSGTPRAL